MDREKQIEEIYEEIKYGTGSYSDDARSVAEIFVKRHSAAQILGTFIVMIAVALAVINQI